MLQPESREHIRRLVRAVSDEPTTLPMREIVDLVDGAEADIVVDAPQRTPIVYVTPRNHPVLAVLTPREREVARLVAAGMRNRQIADSLFISLATVKDHVHNILSKTGLEGRAAIVSAWYGVSEPG